MVIPSASAIFSSDNQRVVVNDTQGYVARPSRAICIQDPRIPLRLNDSSIEAIGSLTDLSTLTEAGIVGSDASARFVRTADSLDSSKAAFALTLKQGEVVTFGKPRIEFAQSGVANRLFQGRRLYVGFAMLLPSLWKHADATLTGNIHAATDETLVMQIHEFADGGDEVAEPPFSLVVVGGGATTPQNARMYATIRTTPALNTVAAQVQSRVVFSELDYPADVWQYWILEMRRHWDATKAPYFNAWRRVGPTGAYTQVFTDSLPNQYNNTADDYAKHGIYYYADAWTYGITSRQIQSKGLHVFDADALTFSDVSQFMDAI